MAVKKIGKCKIIQRDRKYRYETGVLLTPKKAAKWLEGVKYNREISQKTVNKYAKVMKDGDWTLKTGETFKFDWNGEFRDGQHRAWAVIESGVSILVDVCYGMDPDAIKDIDQCHGRTTADTLEMESKGSGAKIARSQSIASALNIVAANLSGDIYKKQYLSNSQAWAMFNEHKDIVESASLVCKKGALCSKSVMVAMHYILTRTKTIKQHADAFFESLVSGENLDKGSPVLALRSKFISTKMDGRASLGRRFTISCITRAWNTYVYGKRTNIIQWLPENLPKLITRLPKKAVN